jgi:peptidoglycan/LPS O-acetylase OafA/YrhL
MPALDGLRALSVAMVFTVHALPQLRFPGGLGVDIFFVISGFLITRILLKEYRRDGRIDLRAFYLKRALRLYPALLLVCAAFLAFFVVLRHAMPVALLKVSAIALTYVSNIWMTVTGDYIGHLSHTWSLATEEQFYLVWPLLLLGLLRFRNPALIVAVLAVAGLAAWALFGADQPYNPLLKAGGLLVGCLVAFLVERRPWQHAGLAYAAVGVFVACLWADSAGIITRGLSLPIVSVTIPFVILHLAFGAGPLVRLLSSRPLVHLGVLSYGLYLWHYVVLSALGMMGYKPGLTMTIAAALISYVTAYLSYRFVEQPILQLKARIPVKEPAPVPA